jgi:nucleoside-diphosphate-sugar epimerase
MKIAITGASGFIGKLLVEKHLFLNDEVHVLTRKKDVFHNHQNLIIHNGSFADSAILEVFLKNADVLYHCAAEIKDEFKMDFVNVEGTKKLISAAKNNIKHWVQLSSVGVYGPISSGIVSETQSYNPINKYEQTKLQSDLLVLDATKNNFFTSTIIRPSNVFGASMSNQSLFQLIQKIDQQIYFFIGKKGASANYVPVENVIEALYLAATNPNAKNGIYIISNWCTIEDFVNNIAKELGKPLPNRRISIGFIKFVAKLTSFIPRNPLTVTRVAALSNRVIYETTKIKKELDYKSVVTVEETIKKLVHFYKENN